MTERETIKSRIAKLLAKAEGTDNVLEADAFMAKVNELLEEHQIELHEVRKAGGEDNDPMGVQDGETNLYASIKWARDVAGALAHYYGCRFVFWRRGNHFKYQVVGRESARMTFELMLPFVISQAKVQAKRLWVAQGGYSLPVWERQVGQALYVRIWGLVPKVEERRSELTKNALVPVTDVDAFKDNLFKNLKKGPDLKLSFSRAAREAAEKVSLHHQATGTRTKLLK
jgi:hypothetical protein